MSNSVTLGVQVRTIRTFTYFVQPLLLQISFLVARGVGGICALAVGAGWCRVFRCALLGVPVLCGCRSKPSVNYEYLLLSSILGIYLAE